MIRLSKLTDYAIALLAQMAEQQERLWAASELAEVTGLSQPTVSKVMKLLTKARLIGAQRGVTGGYRLLLPPKQMSLVDVIEAMDGPIAITDCAQKTEHDCVINSTCPIQGRWTVINRAIRRGLGDVSLADLMHPTPGMLEVQP